MHLAKTLARERLFFMKTLPITPFHFQSFDVTIARTFLNPSKPYFNLFQNHFKVL